MFLAWIALGGDGTGKSGGASTTGRALSASVSPVCVSLSLTAATMSPAAAPAAVEPLLADQVVERAQLLRARSRVVFTSVLALLEVARVDTHQREVAQVLLGEVLNTSAPPAAGGSTVHSDPRRFLRRLAGLRLHVERRGRMSTTSSSTSLTPWLWKAEQQKTGREVALYDALAQTLADLGDRSGRRVFEELVHQLLVAGRCLLHQARRAASDRVRHLGRDRTLELFSSMPLPVNV